MSQIIENLLTAGLSTGTCAEFLGDLRLGWRAKLVLAQERQAAIARALDRNEDGGEEVFVEGLGQRVACVDPVIYFEMIRRYGPKCWRDAEFRRRMLRDEEGLKVRARARRTTVRVAGLREGSPRPSGRSYGEGRAA